MLALPRTIPSRVTIRFSVDSSAGTGVGTPGGGVGTTGGGGVTTTIGGGGGGGTRSGCGGGATGRGVTRVVSTGGGGGGTTGSGGLALAKAGPTSAGSVESRWAAMNAKQLVGASIFIQSPLISISLTT